MIERPKHVKCVLAAEGNLRDENVRPTRCGRNAAREFVFLDPAHAIHESHRKLTGDDFAIFVVCGACVDAIKAATTVVVPGTNAALRLLHENRWDSTP